jgi:hypothetical protein
MRCMDMVMGILLEHLTNLALINDWTKENNDVVSLGQHVQRLK